MFPLLFKSVDANYFNCEVYQLAKHHHVSSLLTNITSFTLFTLILLAFLMLIDLIGFFSFVDDCSRIT